MGDGDMDYDSLGELSFVPEAPPLDILSYVSTHNLHFRQFVFFLRATSGQLPQRKPHLLAQDIDSAIPLHADIAEARFARDGRLLIKTSSLSCARQIAGLTHLLGCQLTVTLDYTSIASKFLLRRVDTDIPVADIAAQLRRRNLYPLNVRRFSRLTDGVRSPTTTVLCTVLGLSIPSDVALFYSIFPCEKFVDRPSLCGNCKRFGHSRKKCRSSFRCGRCAQFHDTGDCSTDALSCPGCKGAHLASDPQCPRFLEHSKILTIQAALHCNFQEASREFRRTTYATTVSSSPSPAPTPVPATGPAPPTPVAATSPATASSSAVFLKEISSALSELKHSFLSDITTLMKDMVVQFTTCLRQAVQEAHGSPASPRRKVGGAGPGRGRKLKPKSKPSSANFSPSLTVSSFDFTSSPAPPLVPIISPPDVPSTGVKDKFDFLKEGGRRSLPVSADVSPPT